MATWDLQASAGATGKSILWRGTWSSASSYNPYDAVVSSSSGSSYISKTNNANKDPVSNPADWDILAGSGTGGVVQTVTQSYGGTFSTTGLIPVDNTIPQIGEGGLMGTGTPITLKYANSSVMIWFSGMCVLSVAAGATVAVFRNSVPDAIFATGRTFSASFYQSIDFNFRDLAPGAGTHTYSFRFGGQSASTMQFNGLFGASSTVNIVLMEIKG